MCEEERVATLRCLGLVFGASNPNPNSTPDPPQGVVFGASSTAVGAPSPVAVEMLAAIVQDEANTPTAAAMAAVLLASLN
jgi:hypothetical protein